uniref:Uncharacterized protein n=1 Tax=Ditylenchus dipsaci TaxID=166011 RepID=A0A915DCR6_9BILA
MYLKLHRYLIRQYLYPLLAFLFLLLLIKWNSLPKPGTTGSQFHDQDFLIEFPPQTMVISRPITSEDMSILLKEPTKALVEEKRVDETETPTKSVSSSEKDLPDTTNAKAIKPSKKGNVVDLTVFMEAQCPDTTGFIKRRVNVTVVPFGKRIVLGKNKTTSHVSATWCGRV